MSVSFNLIKYRDVLCQVTLWLLCLSYYF